MHRISFSIPKNPCTLFVQEFNFFKGGREMSYTYAPVGNMSGYSRSSGAGILAPYKSYGSGGDGDLFSTLAKSASSLWENVLHPVTKGLGKILVPAAKGTAKVLKPLGGLVVGVGAPLLVNLTTWGAKQFREKAIPRIKKAITDKGEFEVNGNTLIYYKKGDLPAIIETYGITQISAFAFADFTDTDLYLSAAEGKELILLPNAMSKCNALRVHLDDTVHFTGSSFINSSCFLMIEGVNIYDKLKLCQEKRIYAEFRVWINNKYLLQASNTERVTAIRSFLSGTGADKFLEENPTNMFILKMGEDENSPKKKKGILGSVTSYKFLPKAYFDGTPELLETRNKFFYMLKHEVVSDEFTLEDLRSITIFNDDDLNLESNSNSEENEFEEFANFGFANPENQIIKIQKTKLMNIKEAVAHYKQERAQKAKDIEKSISDTQEINIPPEAIQQMSVEQRDLIESAEDKNESAEEHILEEQAKEVIADTVNVDVETTASPVKSEEATATSPTNTDAAYSNLFGTEPPAELTGYTNKPHPLHFTEERFPPFFNFKKDRPTVSVFGETVTYDERGVGTVGNYNSSNPYDYMYVMESGHTYGIDNYGYFSKATDGTIYRMDANNVPYFIELGKPVYFSNVGISYSFNEKGQLVLTKTQSAI